jgi:hypothetical protein
MASEDPVQRTISQEELPCVLNRVQSQLRCFRLDRKLRDRSPLRRAMDDNKNSHRAETEIG